MYHADRHGATVRREQIGVSDCAILHRCNAQPICWLRALGFSCRCINSPQCARSPCAIARTLGKKSMSATTGNLGPTRTFVSWRTPLVIILCGCVIALLGFGPRSSLGFFIKPMGQELSWGRDVFGLAIAFQNLLWGLGQPIAGAVADRFGLFRVMCVGALLYAGGLLLMRYSSTPLSLNIGAGVMVGFGLAGCSFNLVLSAFTKLLPAEKRGLALGAGTAAGSFGQFLFAPIGVALIDNFGWQQALTVFGFLMLLIIPLSLALSTPPAESSASKAPA